MDNQTKKRDRTEYGKQYRAKNCNNPEWKERRKEYQKKFALNLKIDVMRHYSKGKPRCECCKEDGIYFLSIDHINGQGHKHRREVLKSTKYGGTRFYSWIKRNGYPEGFQVLCYNCNFAKGTKAQCPHKTQPQ